MFFEEVDDNGLAALYVRWVITEKTKNGNSVVKARLVARGFEEELMERTDSPTCSKESLRLVLSIATSLGWKCKSVDVKTAFLQSEVINRDIYVRPPLEFDEGKIWRLNKCVYGLGDAARSWYNTLREVLVKLGMRVCSLDPALFFYCQGNEVAGYMCVHVDDILFAGREVFHAEVVKPMMRTIEMGQADECSFKYLGVNIDEQDCKIVLHQTDYVDSLETVSVSKERLNRRSDNLGSREMEEYRALVGQLNWLSTQTRPDISFSVCQLAKAIKSATVDDMVKANKVVDIVKKTPVALTYSKLSDVNSLVIECFSDASYGNLVGGGSQGATWCS